MSADKFVSLAKARADFGAVLRLTQRFGAVKIMHGSRRVGGVVSAQAWERVASIVALPPLTDAEREACMALAAEEGAAAARKSPKRKAGK